MRLRIHSLQGTVYDGKAKRLTLPTEVGEITVLEDHEPLISVTRQGLAIVEDQEGKEQFFRINSGFLEVKSGSEVLVLAD